MRKNIRSHPINVMKEREVNYPTMPPFTVEVMKRMAELIDEFVEKPPGAKKKLKSKYRGWNKYK